MLNKGNGTGTLKKSGLMNFKISNERGVPKAEKQPKDIIKSKSKKKASIDKGELSFLKSFLGKREYEKMLNGEKVTIQLTDKQQKDANEIAKFF
jgi:hypothetical protein